MSKTIKYDCDLNSNYITISFDQYKSENFIYLYVSDDHNDWMGIHYNKRTLEDFISELNIIKEKL